MSCYLILDLKFRNQHLLPGKNSCITFSIRFNTKNYRSEGIPIATFVDVTERNPQKSVNVSLKHFICVVGNQNVGVTLPLLITKPFNRKCFSIVEENNAVSFHMKSLLF